jgi:anti-sigma B factor antagonist
LLHLDKRRAGGTWYLSLQGEVDLSNVNRVERELRLLETVDDCDRIILDMTELEFIDSAGIAWLVREIRDEEERSQKLKIRGVTPNVRRVLSLTGIDDRLPYLDA